MDKNIRDNITSTLEQLSKTFTVRDIMVKESQLVWADSDSQAYELLQEYPDFDVIPIKQNNQIIRYVHRESAHLYKILLVDLISDSTPILELPSYFLTTDYYFVLSGRRISGFIHFSDLNSQLVKIPYFVLLEAVESRIVERIGNRITEDDIGLVLPKRSNAIKNKMRQLTKENANLNYINLLYFGEMVEFAYHYKVIILQEDEIKCIKDVRNRVDHADRPLIRSKRDAIKLAETRDLCMDILMQLS